MNKKKIYIASDHAGYDLKEFIISSLEKEYEFIDLGCTNKLSVDYPDYANKLAADLDKDRDSFGVLICGTGIGISIAANRHKHIRAAICHEEYATKMSRKHNNANVIVFGSRIIEKEKALEMIKIFTLEKFESARHEIRVKKLS
jgi:ribose 5-phosphate isomerase B